jgi:hypothetical protein
MSLKAFAAKLRAERLATATTATPATDPWNESDTVAGVATVAVAVPQFSKTLLSSPGSQIPASKQAAEAPIANTDGERLRQATLAFRSSPFADQAKALGWDEISLFGVHRGTHPKERMDAWGLIPLLAWNCLSLTLTEIEADAARLTSPRGALLTHPRKRANHDEAIAWQAHLAFAAAHITMPND